MWYENYTSCTSFIIKYIDTESWAGAARCKVVDVPGYWCVWSNGEAKESKWKMVRGLKFTSDYICYHLSESAGKFCKSAKIDFWINEMDGEITKVTKNGAKNVEEI